jgi:hypothetical protein
VPACASCNNGWSDDEVHFRNVLLLAGNITPVVDELWQGKTRRSFAKVDGRKRMRDLVAQLVPVETVEGERHMIYPGRDPRVLRIIRKIVRGLSHHHGLLSPVCEGQVWADVQQYVVPPEFDSLMTQAHAEADVLAYRYTVLDDDAAFHSCWVLRFFDRTPFFGFVYRSEAGMRQFEAGQAIARLIEIRREHQI